MGQDFKRTQDEEGDNETVEQFNELADKLNSFGDKIAKATADARTAIEKKSEMDGADSAKKKQKSSSASTNAGNSTNKGGDDMDFDISDVTSAIDKMIALKGDMKLSEARDWIEENEDTVKDFI